MKRNAPSSARLAEQILDAFPSGAYALSALLRLLDIVETHEVPTAAVECTLQPRMMVNPDFVREHAATPEKLLMLVMHELHHVLLGHTTLFPRTTPAKNFVFDAVINGIVCRMFPQPQFTSFFTDFYSDTRFPDCLLRPWAGWPTRAAPGQPPAIEGLAPRLQPRVLEVHRALYSEGGASYHEVHELLPQLIGEAGCGVPLLGGHQEEGDEHTGLESRSPLIFDVVRGLVEHWPQPPDPIRGRSLADVLRESSVVPLPPSRRAVLRRLIRQVAGEAAGGTVRRRRWDPLGVTSPVPGLDRRTLVQRAMGATPLVYTAAVSWPQLRPHGDRVHVYLDVSGSMESVLPHLYAAVLDCRQLVHPVVHLFSTRVADIGLRVLRQGRRVSTDGTDIACVAEHMQRNWVRRALIVTDGWVGQPRGAHRDALAAARIAVAYCGASTNTRDLAEVANFSCVLSPGDVS